MPHKKFSFFKHTTNGNSADSIEASYKFVPNDKHIAIHCERTCCYYVFDTCDEMVAFLSAQKKDNPELLNFHKVICGKSYQKLRFNVDPPMEFLKQVLPNFEKPKLEAELVKPEPTSLGIIDHLAEVRHYNDYVTKTSLNMAWCSSDVPP